MDNKNVYVRRIKGGEKEGFYPKTCYSAIIDVPPANEGEGKVFSVLDDVLSWISLKTIDGVSILGEGDIHVNEGWQPMIDENNPLNADYIADGTTNAYYTLEERTKLSGIEPGAQVNVQSDWNQVDTSVDDYIKNKPTIPSTAAEVGAIPVSEKGSSNGVAELDSNGKVPSSQLPSYVDDVLEYADLASFPATGESGKIYIAQDTNKTYRWSGSDYVEISESLALGETSSSAYRGDRGKTAYDHSQIIDGSNPHNTTFSNIENKPTTIAGYGITDAFSGDYDDLSNKPTIPDVISDLTDVTTSSPLNDDVLAYNSTTQKWENTPRTTVIIREWFNAPDALNFTMPNGGTITLTRTGSPTTVTLEYTLDGGATWTEWVENGTTRTLTLNAGEKVYIRNTSTSSTGFSTSISDYYCFSFDNPTRAGGDVASLLCVDTSSATTTNWIFARLFYNQTNLLTAPEISVGCSIASFYSMFEGCINMTTPPSRLVGGYIYNSACAKMFYNCSSLVRTPEIDATRQDQQGMDYMFYNCLSLASACELKIKTLAVAGMRQLFYGCSALTEIRTQMTNISAANCLFNWMAGVAATGDFYCPSSLTIPTGNNGIPSGWTRHDI